MLTSKKKIGFKVEKIMTLLCASVFMIAILSSCFQADHDSDIQYGPIETTYSLPDVSGIIYYVSPNGDVNSDGLTLEHPTTIENAFKKVYSGDAIVLRGGTYRTGDLLFNQGITIQAYKDEKPVLNGTLVASSWDKVDDGLWVTDWEHFFPAGPEDWWSPRNIVRTPLHRFNNDAVFIDGDFLQSAGNTEEVDEGTYYVDYDNKKIYIGADPEGRLVEITAFRKAIYRTSYAVNGKEPDNRGPHIRGITFSQYADTMVHIGGVGLAIDQHGKDAVGTIFENCVFSKCFRMGVFALSDSLIMRNCKVVDTNTEGVYIVASSDILLERNIFENNNIEEWTGFFPSAVKIFNQSHRAIVRDNLVTDHPHSNGVWWDVGNHDGVFMNNYVENVGDGGCFFEISDGLTVFDNTFVDCFLGVHVLNSANVKIYNNVLVNSKVSVRRDSRGDRLGVFGWHVTLGPGVEEREGHVLANNLFYQDKDQNTNIIDVNQPGFMCERLNKAPFDVFDANVFVRLGDDVEEGSPLIRWSPYSNERCSYDYSSPAELHADLPEYSENCQYYQNFNDVVFEDLSDQGYKLSKKFPGYNLVTSRPDFLGN